MNFRAIVRIKPLYRLLNKMRRMCGRGYMYACHAISGIRPNTVFFSSFKGRDYSDSPARISEALHRLCPEAELIWQLSDSSQAPEYVRVVRPRTPAALRAISTSRCIVDNFNRPNYMLKFNDQRYVQTWHGDRGFKRMLYDMEDGQFFPDGDQMDLAVSGSDFGTKNFRTAFRYPGEVMQLGMPRNDALLSRDPDVSRKAREKLGLPQDCRVLLYAPTFREDRKGRAQPAGFDLARVLDRLEQVYHVPYLCLVRAHSQNLRVSGAEDRRIRDVTDWPETTDLLLCADLLISDYSSICGDYILLNRPIILYQPDLEQFTLSNRQMYFKLRDCPYAWAASEDELLSMLDDIDALIPQCAEVRKFYGVTETGRSAEAVAQWIAGQLVPNAKEPNLARKADAQ